MRRTLALLAVLTGLIFAAGQSLGQMTTTGAGKKPTAAGGGCTEASNFLTRSGSTTHDTNYTTLICGLVTDGVWSSLDALHIFATDTSAHALLSLVSATYNATVVGTPTFTADQGYTSSNFANNIDLTFNPSTAVTPHFTQNAASFGFWGYANIGVIASAAIGNSASGTTGESNIFPDYTGAQFYACINDPSCTFVASAGTQGLITGDRTGSTTSQNYQNGAQVGSNVSSTSAIPANLSFKTPGGPNGLGTYTGQVSGAFIGGTLGATKQGQLYTRLRTYMTAVGVP